LRVWPGPVRSDPHHNTFPFNDILVFPFEASP
jgi:hypothetical protein